MRKFITAALAASILTAPVFAAPYGGHDNRGWTEQRHDDRGRFEHRRDYRPMPMARQWRRGERFDHRYARDYRVIGNPGYYHLHPAPRGYRWVRSGNDAVLIGITTGIIASVIANSVR